MDRERATATFSGGALDSFGYSLLYAVLAVFVLPAAWGATSFLRWLTGKVTFSDGTRLRFEGNPGSIWFLFAVYMFLSYLPQVVGSAGDKAKGHVLVFVLTLVLLPLTTAVFLPVCRWVIEGLTFEPGGRLEFTGRYVTLLGWQVLLVASFLTIIGPAWVTVAMWRWFCDNMEGKGLQLEFKGTGWGLLWRVLAGGAACCLIIPIPWVLRWLYGWCTANLALVHEDGLAVGPEVPRGLPVSER